MTQIVSRKGKGKAVVHIDRMRKLPNPSDSESANSHTHNRHTEPTIQPYKRRRTTNAIDSMTDTHCMDTTSRTDRADRLLPLVKSTHTPVDTDSDSVNVCTRADTDAVATYSATKPLPWRQRRHRRPARYLSNVELSLTLIGRVGAPFPIILESACCRLGSVRARVLLLVEKVLLPLR